MKNLNVAIDDNGEIVINEQHVGTGKTEEEIAAAIHAFPNGKTAPAAKERQETEADMIAAMMNLPLDITVKGLDAAAKTKAEAETLLYNRLEVTLRRLGLATGHGAFKVTGDTVQVPYGEYVAQGVLEVSGIALKQIFEDVYDELCNDKYIEDSPLCNSCERAEDCAMETRDEHCETCKFVTGCLGLDDEDDDEEDPSYAVTVAYVDGDNAVYLFSSRTEAKDMQDCLIADLLRDKDCVLCDRHNMDTAVLKSKKSRNVVATVSINYVYN